MATGAGLPDEDAVVSALLNYAHRSLRTFLIGLAMTNAAAYTADTLPSRYDIIVVLVGVAGLVFLGTGFGGLIRTFVMWRISRRRPWQWVEFAYRQTAGIRGSGTGWFFLREPGTKGMYVLHVAAVNRGWELNDVEARQIPFCGTLTDGGMVYVAHRRRLLRVKPFWNPETANDAVPRIARQQRMTLPEKEYQESFRNPPVDQYDIWSDPDRS